MRPEAGPRRRLRQVPVEAGGVHVRTGRTAGRLGPVEMTVVRGDITTQDVDAVVNAANGSLLGGGGVDGAIHRAGGPAVLDECRALRAGRLRDGLPTGDAVATTAGRLPARWVIHTVGPVWSPDEDRAGLLASCHRRSLEVATELGARSVAFPAISCGVYGYPVEQAAPIAVRAVREAGTGVDQVRFVLFGDDTFAAFERAVAAG